MITRVFLAGGARRPSTRRAHINHTCLINLVVPAHLIDVVSAILLPFVPVPGITQVASLIARANDARLLIRVSISVLAIEWAAADCD